MESCVEDIQSVLSHVEGRKNNNGVLGSSPELGSYTASPGPYYATSLNISEAPRQPQALTHRGTPSWGSSATQASFAFDAFENLSTCSASTAPSTSGPEPVMRQRPAIADFGAGSLPCEFRTFANCSGMFPLHQANLWIEHMIHEHLRGAFPIKSLCWFCDDVQFESKSSRQDDKMLCYRQRMHHIASHFYQGLTAANIRPDFNFLDHLLRNRLISEEMFRRASQHGELPARYIVHDWYGNNRATEAYDAVVESRTRTRQRLSGRHTHRRHAREH